MNICKPALYLIVFLLFSVSFAYADRYHSDSLSRKKQADSIIISLKQKINDLNITGLVIDGITYAQEGYYLRAEAKAPSKDLPAFYAVALTVKPVPGSSIRIEVWLPEKNWNGRLLGTGNGGGAGSISVGSLSGGLKQGYATANTDMGTYGGANSAVNRPETWIDFGYRATHLMTTISKAVLKTFYGKAQHHAYFVGCSTGGQQALMEAQRFPDDYNGIIAGAPANNRTHLHTGFLFNHQITNAGGKPMFTAAELAFVSRKIIAAYVKESGGAPGDNFLTDPGMVKVDFDALFKCKPGSQDTCLTDVQITALKKIYAGAINPQTNEQIYTSPPVGAESVSGGLVYQQTANGGNDLFYQFKWVWGKNFDYAKFDFNKDMAKMDSVLAPVLNANDPDLDPLKKLGGKIVMYTGTADPLVPYQDALNYYKRVIEKQHSLSQTQSFFRYYLIPGMGHCGGGPGLNGFGHNILTDLVDWVEQGKAPEQITASGVSCCDAKAAGRFQRPVYPYPKFPQYVSGDVNAASSYIGVHHPRSKVIKPDAKYLK